jgi:hypothetical protein
MDHVCNTANAGSTYKGIYLLYKWYQTFIEPCLLDEEQLLTQSWKKTWTY